MSALKKKTQAWLEAIRNPARDDDERAYRRRLWGKRLLFLLPFIVAAAVFLLLSMD